MRVLAYLLALLTALPGVAFAIGILVLGQVVATRNVFSLVYDLLIAYGYGVPILAVTLLCLFGAGFFQSGRFVGSLVLAILNLAAFAIVLTSPAAPKSFSESVFLLPGLLSTTVALLLVRGAFHAGPFATLGASAPPTAPSKTPA